jgi:hypothetical protein
MPSVGDTIIYNSGHLPAGATTPLTYQWGLSPIGSGTINGSSTGNTVSITWNNTGTHTVNLSMTNCGATVSNSSSIVVTAACVPVTTVTMAGNFTQRLGDTETYTVSLLPANFSTPVTYDWTLGSGGTIISGQGTDSIDISWTSYGADGHHLITCEVYNACSNIEFDTRNTTMCVPITGFDFRIGLAINPSSMTITNGTTHDIDISNVVPVSPGVGNVTFRIGIYDASNSQLYLSVFSTEGNPLNYTFNDLTATKLVVGVYSDCEYISEEVTLNII